MSLQPALILSLPSDAKAEVGGATARPHSSWIPRSCWSGSPPWCPRLGARSSRLTDSSPRALAGDRPSSRRRRRPPRGRRRGLARDAGHEPASCAGCSRSRSWSVPAGSRRILGAVREPHAVGTRGWERRASRVCPGAKVADHRRRECARAGVASGAVIRGPGFSRSKRRSGTPRRETRRVRWERRGATRCSCPGRGIRPRRGTNSD